jgi:serine/threonine protein kinase
MNIEPDSKSGKPGVLATEEVPPQCLPVRFRRAPAAPDGKVPERGMMPAKQPRAYYLDGLAAVFHPGVSLPGILRVDHHYSGAEVALLYPGPSAEEVLGLVNRFPEIKCLHVIESGEANLDAIRSELQKELGHRELPELAGYITDICHLPEELAGRCELVVEANAFDPKADKIFRQEAAREISRLLKLGGLFYSAGVTIRWTDRVYPLTLVRLSIRAKIFRQTGYSDALPRPVFHLKRSTDNPNVGGVETFVGDRWEKIRAWFGRKRKAVETVTVAEPFVPRVEDGRGEPNLAPWDFLITKPAIRRPPMDWTPKAGDRFGNVTLGALMQHNRQTGMHVFRVRECPEVVLKIMKPFEGDIPDDPLEWDRLRKSKTLKRENQALKQLKGIGFIPQRIAHGYDPVTGWYAIVIQWEAGRSLQSLIDRRHNRLRRHHESAQDVAQALEPVLMLLNSLAVVHEQGLVHQDLKPAHVLLRADGMEAALIDWGLARQMDEPLSEEKRSCSWIHTPPERLDVTVPAAASPHQDLYAVGVMLFQLAGELDFDEQPRFLFDYFLRQGHTPSAAELESLLRPHWKWAATVIARAIRSRKEVPGYADNRYTSAREMAQEIQAARVRATS